MMHHSVHSAPLMRLMIVRISSVVTASIITVVFIFIIAVVDVNMTVTITIITVIVTSNIATLTVVPYSKGQCLMSE